MSRPGAVLWFTGLPASGKSTLALEVQRALGRPAVLLDSDALRAAVFPDLGYGPAARDRFYRALAELAALLARQGHLVLVAATAHRRAYRAHARRLAPRFIEVFVDTAREECARRDPKGLYRAGVALPGRGPKYEAPLHPEVRAEGGATPAAVRACLTALAARRRGSRARPAAATR
ncbi:MAG: adenylyl-sulfate kinase [Archangiaceae bacterium]|nr:adenylyl-sulfate kinase [Archangiaceae bacterium]